MREFRILGLIHAVSLEEALSQERSRAIARAETDKRPLMGSTLRQLKAAVSRISYNAPTVQTLRLLPDPVGVGLPILC